MSAAECAGSCCAVLELRQYTLHPGRRDTLIELFEREFVTGQEAAGMTILGQFRDLDDPDRFVWMRGFRDMDARRKALTAFYGGPAWTIHRDAANATMIAWDDVLLLRPSHAGAGFTLPSPGDEREDGAGMLTATIHHLRPDAAPAFADFFEREMAPVLADAGAAVLAHFVTEPAENSYPALPVREGETVFAWFARFGGPGAYERHLRTLAGDERWTGGLAGALAARATAPADVLRLAPTERSRLR